VDKKKFEWLKKERWIDYEDISLEQVIKLKEFFDIQFDGDRRKVFLKEVDKFY